MFWFWKKKHLTPAEINALLIPPEYHYLTREKHPKILMEALKLYGTKEITGSQSNPVIIEWAKEVGGWIGRFYKSDDVPWCGLFMAVLCKRAGLPYNQKALTALSWAAWGNPTSVPMLGDVLTFTRNGGGHVGIYVGEDEQAFHVLGGNQSDQVNITRISKHRLYEARRTAWRWAQPSNIRRIWLGNKDDYLSENEA